MRILSMSLPVSAATADPAEPTDTGSAAATRGHPTIAGGFTDRGGSTLNP